MVAAWYFMMDSCGDVVIAGGIAPGGAVSVADPAAGALAGAAGRGTDSGAWRGRYRRRLFYIDAGAVAASVLIAQWLRFGVWPGSGDRGFADYNLVSPAVATAWMLSLAINRARSPRVIGAGLEEYRRVVVATLAVFGAIAVVSMLLKLEIARGYLVLMLPLGLSGLLTGRYVARRLVRRARLHHGRCRTRVLVVGNPGAVRDLAVNMVIDAEAGFDVVAACVPGPQGGRFIDGRFIEVPGHPPIPVRGDVDNVIDVVVEADCGAVALVATDRLDAQNIRALSWQLETLEVDLMVAPGVVDVSGTRLTLKPVAGLPLIHVEKPQYSGAQRFQKRAFDLVVATAVLVLSSPLLLGVVLAFTVTSAGPVLQRSERIGLDGEPFEMLEFRTGSDDARLTSLGRLLRRLRLDTLPQFINVLRRDMSVVGPRPPLAAEVATYDDESRRRLLVKPGVTGLWQVTGRADLSWADAARLDLFYVENWSMTADLLIVVKTLRALLAGSGGS
jgi:exopolysaccharide biosynthesis polyprenyl glycosylphosphotransferase